MNQLLEIQRLELQKGATTSEAEAKALTDSKHLFLSNQAKYQDLNDVLENLRERAQAIQEKTAEFAPSLKIRGRRLTASMWV
jgi:hypothetical protein